MESKEQKKLRFLGVDFVDVHFKSIKKIEDEKVKINVNVDPFGFLPAERPGDFYVIMKTMVSSEDYFHLELTAIGNFKIIPPDLSEEEKQNFVNVNSPAIMFPYIRAFISTFTSSLGKSTGNINIPTRFFHGKLKFIEDTKELIDSPPATLQQ